MYPPTGAMLVGGRVSPKTDTGPQSVFEFCGQGTNAYNQKGQDDVLSL